MTGPAQVSAVDPFDLPEWLGTSEVTWTATTSVHAGHSVRGELSGGESHSLACDLLGVDQAFPQPVVADAWRQRAHQAWTHDQVLLVEYAGRLTLAVPGKEFTADDVLDALGRFTKAVGAPPGRYLAALRL